MKNNEEYSCESYNVPMFKINIPLVYSNHRLYAKDSDRTVDKGIRSYGKCLGFFALIFGFGSKLKSGNKVWIVNKKSYKNWNKEVGQRYSSTLLPILIRNTPSPKKPLPELPEDVWNLVAGYLPKKDLLTYQKVETPLTKPSLSYLIDSADG